MKNIAIISIWGPILRAMWRNRGSSDFPKMEKLEKISNNFAQNSN